MMVFQNRYYAIDGKNEAFTETVKIKIDSQGRFSTAIWIEHSWRTLKDATPSARANQRRDRAHNKSY